MKEQHRMETPHQRHQRGLRMSGDDFADLAYLRGIEATLTEEQLEEFRELLFSPECRGVAGIRPAADLALAAMRAKLMLRLGKPSWRAAT